MDFEQEIKNGNLAKVGITGSDRAYAWDIL